MVMCIDVVSDQPTDRTSSTQSWCDCQRHLAGSQETWVRNGRWILLTQHFYSCPFIRYTATQRSTWLTNLSPLSTVVIKCTTCFGIKNHILCPYSVFMHFVLLSENRANISPITYYCCNSRWAFLMEMKYVVSGFRRGVNEVFALLRCYGSLIGN
jgi:hypothetical protein